MHEVQRSTLRSHAGVRRKSRDWRQSLRALLDLIEAISRQLAEADPSSEDCSDARSLALVHMPAQGPHRRLALMIGQGDPMHWRLPIGCSLLRAADCETLTLPDFCSRPLFVEVRLFATPVPEASARHHCGKAHTP